ncbi:MAG TPA: low molecular weight protein-tyrosine-phosphatase [Catalimonadaceae bacterium]|nr:low molecular weight protein-tyrosine-phosphatase [Catalimonadaceae bacterium]
MISKILFVCLGNICRSPLAEAIFKKQLEERNLSEKYQADSCGTSGLHVGERPDARTIRNARHHGLEIDHTGRQLSVSDLSSFDLILTMDRSNHQFVLDMARPVFGSRAEIKMIRSFDPEALGAMDVPDPWYGKEEGFEEIYQILSRTCKVLIDHLENQKLAKEKAGKVPSSSL